MKGENKMMFLAGYIFKSPEHATRFLKESDVNYSLCRVGYNKNKKMYWYIQDGKDTIKGKKSFETIKEVMKDFESSPYYDNKEIPWTEQKKEVDRKGGKKLK